MCDWDIFKSKREMESRCSVHAWRSSSKDLRPWSKLAETCLCCQGAVVCLAFVHNLLRRHPACIALLDKSPPAGKAAAASSGADPYLEEEADPSQSRALQSSLWELKTLSMHFYWQVTSNYPSAAHCSSGAYI